jgi:hypothetical protein
MYAVEEYEVVTSIRPASIAAYRKSPNNVKVIAPATSKTDGLRVESPNNRVARVNKTIALMPSVDP